MKKLMFGIMVAVFFTVGLACAVFAQEAAKEENKDQIITKTDVKEAKGEVVYITKRSISLVTARDKEKGEETEILLPYEPKEIKVEHKKSIADFQTGDIVLIRYIDETIDDGNKKENVIKAKLIRFIAPAPADSPYKKAVEAKPQEGETLPLKGAR